MAFFIGEYTHTIDTKKRVAVPAKFRMKIQKGGVVTRGLDNCLFLYPKEEWQAMAEKLSKLPISRIDARGFSRLMLSGAMEVKLDQLGRILIPEYLFKYASLKKRVVIAGLYNRIEIWDEEKWQNYKQKIEKESGNIAERLSELGI